jgi:predicted Zn-dependent protease
VAEVYDADSAETTAENDAAKQRGLAAAEKAIALAPALADGYTARGWMRSNFTWEWAGAQADLERALAIDPSNSTCSAAMVSLLATQGRMTDAIAAIRKVGSAGSAVGAAVEQPRLLPGRCRAMERGPPGPEAALAINPESSYAQMNLATLELLRATPIPPLAMFRESDGTFRPYGIALAEHSLGHARESQQALDALIADYAQDSAFQIADVYAWRGEKGQGIPVARSRL